MLARRFASSASYIGQGVETGGVRPPYSALSDAAIAALERIRDYGRDTAHV